MYDDDDDNDDNTYVWLCDMVDERKRVICIIYIVYICKVQLNRLVKLNLTCGMIGGEFMMRDDDGTLKYF